VALSATPIGAQPVPPLVVSIDLHRARLRVAGELDRESAHHLLDAVSVLVDAPARRWRLDVRDVTFCDAGGLRALTSAHQLAADAGRVLHLSRTSRPVARLVGLVGYDQVFPASQQGRRDRAGAGDVHRHSRRPQRIGCDTTGTA